MAFTAISERTDLLTKARSIFAMRGITHKEFARRVGFHPMYTRDLFSGVRHGASARRRLAEELGFSSWEEFERADVGIMR